MGGLKRPGGRGETSGHVGVWIVESGVPHPGGDATEGGEDSLNHTKRMQMLLSPSEWGALPHQS